MEAPDSLWKERKKRKFVLIFFPFFFLKEVFCPAVGGLITQREGRKSSGRDKDGSHVCTGWETTYSAEIKFILLVKKLQLLSGVFAFYF